MKKTSEIKEMQIPELDNYLEDLTEELFNLRFQHATKQASSPIRLRTLKHEIARVKTIITEKELKKIQS